MGNVVDIKATEKIERAFTYPHESTPRKAARIGSILESARLLAEAIHEYSDYSREQSLSITALEEAVLWARAAIERGE